MLAVSVDWIDSPVTLPPGRVKLATRPPPTGSGPNAKTMGMTSVACLNVGDGDCICDNNIDLEADKLGCDLGDALRASLIPAILDRDGATLDPTQFAQPPRKGRCS